MTPHIQNEKRRILELEDKCNDLPSSLEMNMASLVNKADSEG